MFKKLSEYLGNQARWNELGHAFFGFIMGCMNPIITLLWVGFVFYEELILDHHWDIWNDTKDECLDFIFDLQSKILPTLLSFYVLHIVYGVNISLLHSLFCFAAIFFFGYKGSWFFGKKK